MLTLADLDDSLRAADLEKQKHVDEVLQLEAWVGEPTNPSSTASETPSGTATR